MTPDPNLLDRASVLKRWPLLDPPGALVTTGAMDPVAVAATYATPWAFASMCEIVDEATEDVMLLDPTSSQYRILDFIHRNLWAYIVKYRQAKATTAVSRVMLRDCMYVRGMKGLLVAERDDTARDIFEGILFSYRNLPPELQAPLIEGTSGGVTQLRFWHGGSIKIQTSGGRSPAVGRGLGWLHLTEFGEALWQRRAAISILPSVAKRKKARVVIETTPGPADSHSEKMWHEALNEDSASKFRALFLRWWEDESCLVGGKGDDVDAEARSPRLSQLRLTAEETAYAASHPATGRPQLLFRRQMLATVFDSDPRLFETKYPSGEYEGWFGALSPILPADLLTAALREAINPVAAGPVMAVGGSLHIDPLHPYVVVADPAGFSASGDPSGLLVFDAVDRRDVAMWAGREDPGRFAARLAAASKLFTTDAGEPLLVVESNASAVIALVRDAGIPNLLWTSRDHPGWYATDSRIQEAESRLVRLMREGAAGGGLVIRNRPTLQQLLKYDGSNRGRRSAGPDGVVHHFDLARCAIIGADVMSRRYFTAAVEDRVSQRLPGSICIADLDRMRADEIRKSLDPTRPPPLPK